MTLSNRYNSGASTRCYRYKLLRFLLLAGCLNNDAFAFVSQHSLLQPFRQNIQPAVTSYRNTPLAAFSIQKFFGTVEWNDVLYDDTSTAFDAWEWTSNMGAPSALIAAAVLVTLSETRISSVPQRDDKRWVRFTKRLMRFLLMSAFALEVASIFVGNMTGSLLLGKGPQVAGKLVGYGSPLQLLQHHHEAEYLFTQISFLQGLIHWLGATVCELILPHPKETTSARRMNKCLASWLITGIFTMTAFYNDHINFYSDYATMIKRFVYVTWARNKGRFRVMQLFYLPSLFVSIGLTWKAFTSPPDED